MIPEAWVSIGMITAGLCLLLSPCFVEFGNSSEELRSEWGGIGGLALVMLHFALFYLSIVLFVVDVGTYLVRKNTRHYVTRDFLLR